MGTYGLPWSRCFSGHRLSCWTPTQTLVRLCPRKPYYLNQSPNASFPLTCDVLQCGQQDNSSVPMLPIPHLLARFARRWHVEIRVLIVICLKLGTKSHCLTRYGQKKSSSGLCWMFYFSYYFISTPVDKCSTAHLFSGARS